MINPFKLLKERERLLALCSNHLYFSGSSAESFWGGLNSSEEEALTRLVRQCGEEEGPIVEFGTLFGWSTLLMASAKSPRKRLVTVDNFSWNPFMLSPSDHERFARRCLQLAESHFGLELVASELSDFKTSWDQGRPSLVFIDAAHDYTSVLDDIAWCKSVKARIICGHDYSSSWPGVQRAVNESFNDNFHLVDSLWWWESDSSLC